MTKGIGRNGIVGASIPETGVVGHDDVVVFTFLAHVGPFRLLISIYAVCTIHIEHALPTAQVDDFGRGGDILPFFLAHQSLKLIVEPSAFLSEVPLLDLPLQTAVGRGPLPLNRRVDTSGESGEADGQQCGWNTKKNVSCVKFTQKYLVI